MTYTVFGDEAIVLFSVSSQEGHIAMRKGLEYTTTPNDEPKHHVSPKRDAGSLIVGRKTAFNFFSGQHYAVELVSRRVIRLAEVENKSFSSFIGCQESYEIRKVS